MKPATRKLVYTAVMIALATVLSVFRIPLGDFFELSLAPVIVLMASAMIGPVYGIAAAVLADFLGTLILGTGYSPVFIIMWVLYGLLPGLIIRRLPASFPRVLGTTALTQVLCSLIINSVLIYVFYISPGSDTSFAVFFMSRLAPSLISLAVYVIVFYLLQKKLARFSLRTSVTEPRLS